MLSPVHYIVTGLFWLWFAFGAVAAIFWLMIARPELEWFRLA